MVLQTHGPEDRVSKTYTRALWVDYATLSLTNRGDCRPPLSDENRVASDLIVSESSLSASRLRVDSYFPGSLVNWETNY